ncbi:MAG: DNA-binding protein [Sulfuricurvum sp.]
MEKLSIDEAAQKLGVSKEAIHNRIRRKSLRAVVEDGIKYVILEEDAPKQASKSSGAKESDRYTNFLEEQNGKLQKRVELLEGETRALRDQKEQLHIDEKRRIEQIYRDKDLQLKSIVEAIRLALPSQHIEAELSEANSTDAYMVETSEFISLKKWLKKRGVSEKKSKKVQKDLFLRSKDDGRIITIGKKCYIDPLKYDYSDILPF